MGKGNGLTSDKKPVMVNDKEYRLLEELRKISYGQVAIFMENGRPVRIEVIRESVKL